MPGLAVTPEQLQEILTPLSHHFCCTTLLDAYQRWQRGEPVAAGDSRPLLAITFDDGALDNYVHAFPVLERLGLKASFYIPVVNVEDGQAPWHDRLGFALLQSIATLRGRAPGDLNALLLPFGLTEADFAAVLPTEAIELCQRGVQSAKCLSVSDRGRHLAQLEEALGGDQVPDWAAMMSWEQIRELHAAGHEVGSHSMTHPLLPDCAAEQLHEEIAGSLARLRETVGGEVASFCYPNGSYDARCLSEVRAAGYECAVTTRWGLNHRGLKSTAQAFELRRCDMDYARLTTRRGEFSPERLMLRLSGLQPGLNRRD
jgi:peptidoglycan/xylan/chitin deacetylase (PgdA/CDA1 family)